VAVQRDGPTSAVAIWPPAPEWVVLRTRRPNLLIQAGPSHAQIGSRAALALFSLVEHCLFLEALYYRLNTVRLDAPAPVMSRATATD
jgi:hypothetical protein